MLRIAMLCLLALPAAAQEVPPFAAFDLASEAVLNDPHDLAFGPDGRLYVADKFASRVAVFDPETLDLVEVLGEGAFPGIHDIAFGPDGRVAIAVTGTSVVAVFDDVSGLNGPPDALYPAPRTEGAAIHPDGRILAMAGGVGALAAFAAGEEPSVAQGGHFGAHDVAVDLNGDIWVADNAARRLVRYSPTLERLQDLDAAKYGFVGPRYLDVTDFGYLVVADQDAHRVLLIDPAGPEGGTLLGIIGDGSPGIGANKFDDPEGVVVRGSRFWISDSDNNRIVRYSVVIN